MPTMLGCGEPCLWLGDMCPAGDILAGDMWLLEPGDIQWTGDIWELAGDIAGDIVCGGLCIEFGLNGLSSYNE